MQYLDASLLNECMNILIPNQMILYWGNKIQALVSRLPDKGGRIQKQIAELNTQLHDIRNSGSNPGRERKEQEVIDVDDLTKDLQNVLSV